MNLIDSSGWLEYFMNGPLAEAYAPYFKKPQEVTTPTIVLFEVYKKIKGEAGEEQALMAVNQMEKTNVIPLTEGIALQAADISLENKLAMADSIIYATALQRGAKVITSDTDFVDLPHVVYLEDPESEATS